MRSAARVAAILAAGAWLAAAPFLAAPGAALAQEAGELVVKRSPVSGDQYLAGGSVDVLARVDGDLLAVGGQVGVGADVSGDVLALAALVHVAARIGDDLRAAGGRVIVLGEVGDELAVVGGEVFLQRAGHVAGRALVAGGRVRLLGSVGKGLHAAGDVVEIDGPVGGDAVVWARQVILGPSARIAGDLRVTSDAPPRMAPGAVVAGRLSTRAPEPGSSRTPAWRWLVAAALQLGLLAVAGAWIGLAPVLSREAGSAGREEPSVAATVGVGLLLGLPLAALLLGLSVVGIPAALVVAAAWVLLAVAGYASAAVALGDALTRALGRGGAGVSPGLRLAGTLAALVMLRLVAAIPWLGPAAVLAAAAFGAGSVARAGARLSRERRDRGPA